MLKLNCRARTPQPGVTSLAEIDLALWKGDGTPRETEPLSSEDRVHNNTRLAGLGLLAARVYHECAVQPVSHRLTVVLIEFAEASHQPLAWNTDADGHVVTTDNTARSLAKVVIHLITSLCHAADALGYGLNEEPGEGDGEIHKVTYRLLRDLRTTVDADWHPIIGTCYADLAVAAYDRYRAEAAVMPAAQALVAADKAREAMWRAALEHVQARHRVVAEMLRARFPTATRLIADMTRLLDDNGMPEIVGVLDAHGATLANASSCERDVEDLFDCLSEQLSIALQYVSVDETAWGAPVMHPMADRPVFILDLPKPWR